MSEPSESGGASGAPAAVSLDAAWRELVENAPDGILVHAEGRFIYANAAALRLLGASQPDQVIGRNILDFVSPEYRDFVRTRIERIAREGGVNPLAHQRLLRVDGQVVDVEVTSMARPFGGRPAFQAIIRDVSDRIRLEREREADHARLRVALGAVDMAVFHQDRDLRYTWIDQAQLGFRTEEVVGKTDSELLPASSAEKVVALKRRVLETGLGAREEVLVEREKVARWFQIAVEPIRNQSGEVVGLTGAALDITDRKRAEQDLLAKEVQLRQAAKMEAVGQLAGGVAHDFNNLLTVINSYADSVAGAVKDPAVQADLEEIRRAGQRAAVLTRKLLAFSRRSLIHPQVLKLDQVFAEMEKLLQRTLGEHVQLLWRSTPGLWNVKADPGEMEQVLMNLALNARDAMPRGGKLSISVSNVVLDAEESYLLRDAAPGDYVLLEIEDTGVGMAEETLSRLFEPFFTTKADGRGTGLGLATVFGIVKRAAGHIGVASAPGRGSTFQILLPRTLESPSVDRLPVPAASIESGRGRTVLVVEDDAGVRALMTRILTRHGYTVIEAGNGTDALVLHGLHAREIDLVITDIVMPRMSGRTLAEELLREKPDQRILFVSGYADDMLGSQGILQGGVYYLPKPFSEADLLRDVRALIEGAPERARSLQSPKTG